jgi:hypothetical protein
VKRLIDWDPVSLGMAVESQALQGRLRRNGTIVELTVESSGVEC